jgi:hypothetical protein
MLVKFFDLWLTTYKDEILVKSPIFDENRAVAQEKYISPTLASIFFKSCTVTIDLISSKLEFEKSNADNSSETKLNSLDNKEDHLKQISIDH